MIMNNAITNICVKIFCVAKYLGMGLMDHIEGGNRQNRLHLESRTPSWAGLDFELYAQYLWKRHTNWKTRHTPPPDGRAPGLVSRLSIA